MFTFCCIAVLVVGFSLVLAMLINMGKIRAMQHLGFHEYLIRKRLAYAIHMLNNTDDSVLDIALDAGFPDAKALNLAFKKYFDISPNRYRIISKASADTSLKNLYPVRLDFTHPVVQEKLSGYVGCPVSFEVLL